MSRNKEKSEYRRHNSTEYGIESQHHLVVAEKEDYHFLVDLQKTYISKRTEEDKKKFKIP